MNISFSIIKAKLGIALLAGVLPAVVTGCSREPGDTRLIKVYVPPLAAMRNLEQWNNSYNTECHEITLFFWDQDGNPVWPYSKTFKGEETVAGNTVPNEEDVMIQLLGSGYEISVSSLLHSVSAHCNYGNFSHIMTTDPATDVLRIVNLQGDSLKWNYLSALPQFCPPTEVDWTRKEVILKTKPAVARFEIYGNIKNPPDPRVDPYPRVGSANLPLSRSKGKTQSENELRWDDDPGGGSVEMPHPLYCGDIVVTHIYVNNFIERYIPPYTRSFHKSSEWQKGYRDSRSWVKGSWANTHPFPNAMMTALTREQYYSLADTATHKNVVAFHVFPGGNGNSTLLDHIILQMDMLHRSDSYGPPDAPYPERFLTIRCFKQNGAPLTKIEAGAVYRLNLDALSYLFETGSSDLTSDVPEDDRMWIDVEVRMEPWKEENEPLVMN